MKTRSASTIIAAMAGSGAAMALVLAMLSQGCEKNGPSPGESAPDLSNHPLYSKYDYGETESVIDLGFQPFLIPTCLLSEAMTRDELLHEALAAEGMEIRFHSFFKGADENFFLARGDLECAISGDMPTITAVANLDVIVSSIAHQGFCSIVAGKHMLIDELRGKRIGYAFGSNAHFLLLDALGGVDLAEKDVRLVPMDIDEMPGALDRGDIDAFSAWEPTPTIARAEFDDQVVIHRGLSSGYLYFSRSWTERHPEAMRLIVASEMRALSWLREDRENLLLACDWALAGGKLLSKKTAVLTREQYAELTREDFLRIFSHPIIPEQDLSPEGRLAQEFHLLQKLGKISGESTWLEMAGSFDRTIVRTIIEEADDFKVTEYKYRHDPDRSHSPDGGTADEN